MIYEARSYRLSPRGVPEFINIFGKAYQKPQSLSRISAFFYTEIGIGISPQKLIFIIAIRKHSFLL